MGVGFVNHFFSWRTPNPPHPSPVSTLFSSGVSCSQVVLSQYNGSREAQVAPFFPVVRSKGGANLGVNLREKNTHPISPEKTTGIPNKSPAPVVKQLENVKQYRLV